MTMIEARHPSPSRQSRRRRSVGESASQDVESFGHEALLTVMRSEMATPTSLSPNHRHRQHQAHQPQHKQLMQSIPIIADNPQRVLSPPKHHQKKQHKSVASTAAKQHQKQQQRHLSSPAGILSSHNAASTSIMASTSPSTATIITTGTISTSSITDDDGQHRVRPASTSSLMSSLQSPFSTHTESSVATASSPLTPPPTQRPRSSSYLPKTSSGSSSSAASINRSSSNNGNRKSLSQLQKLSSSPLKSGGATPSSNMSVSTYHTAHTNATSSSRKSKSSRCSAVQPKLVDATKLSQSLSQIVDVNFDSIFDFDGDGDGDNDIDASNSTTATTVTRKKNGDGNVVDGGKETHQQQLKPKQQRNHDEKKLTKSTRKQKMHKEKRILSQLHDTVESSNFFHSINSTGSGSVDGEYGISRSSKDDWMRVRTDSSILLSKAGAGINDSGIEELQQVFEHMDEEDGTSDEDFHDVLEEKDVGLHKENDRKSLSAEIRNDNSSANNDEDFFKPQQLQRQDHSSYNCEPVSPIQLMMSSSASKMPSSDLPISTFNNSMSLSANTHAISETVGSTEEDTKVTISRQALQQSHTPLIDEDDSEGDAVMVDATNIVESTSVMLPPPPPPALEYSVSSPAAILGNAARNEIDVHGSEADYGNISSDEVLLESPHTLQRKQRKFRRQQRRLREQQQQKHHGHQQDQRDPRQLPQAIPKSNKPVKEEKKDDNQADQFHQLQHEQQGLNSCETERSDDYISSCSDTLRTNRSDTLHTHESFDDRNNHIDTGANFLKDSLLRGTAADTLLPGFSRNAINDNIAIKSHEPGKNQAVPNKNTEKSLGDVIESGNDIGHAANRILSYSPTKGGQLSSRSIFSNASSAGSCEGGGRASKSVSNFSTGSAATRSMEGVSGGASSKSISSNRSSEGMGGGSKSVSSVATNLSADAACLGSKSVSSAATNRSADGAGGGSKSVSSTTTTNRSADGTVESISRNRNSRSPKGRRRRRNSATSFSDVMTPKQQPKNQLTTPSSSSATPSSRPSHRRRRGSRRRHTITDGIQPPPHDILSSPQRHPAHYRPRRPTSHSPIAPRRASSAEARVSSLVRGSGVANDNVDTCFSGENVELGSILSRTYLRPSRASSPPMRASSPNSVTKRSPKYNPSNLSQHSSIPDLTSISSVLMDVTDDDLSPVPLVPNRNSTPRTATMITAAGSKITVPLVDNPEIMEDLMQSSESISLPASSPSSRLSKKTRSTRRSSLPSPPTLGASLDDSGKSPKSPNSRKSKRRSSLPSSLSDNHRKHHRRPSKGRSRRSNNKKSSIYGTSTKMTASMSDSISMKSDLAPVKRNDTSSRDISLISEDTSLHGSSWLSEHDASHILNQKSSRSQLLSKENPADKIDGDTEEPMKDFLRDLLGPSTNLWATPSAGGTESNDGGVSKSSAMSNSNDDKNEEIVEPVMLQMTETGDVEFETGFPQITSRDTNTNDGFAMEDMDAFADPFGFGGSRDMFGAPPVAVSAETGTIKGPSRRRSSLTDLFGLGTSTHDGSTHSRPRRRSSFLPPPIPDAARTPGQNSFKKKFSIASGSRGGDDKSDVASMSPSTRRRRSSMNIKNFDTWFKRFGFEYDSEGDDEKENGAWELSPGASSSVNDPVQHTGLLSTPNAESFPQKHKHPRRHSYQEPSSLEMTKTEDIPAGDQDSRHGRRRNSVDNASISRLNLAALSDDCRKKTKKEKKRKKKRRLFRRRHSLDSTLQTKRDRKSEGGEASTSSRYSKKRRRPRRMSLPNLSSNSVKLAKKAVKKILIKPAKKIIKNRANRSSSVERMRAVQLMDDDDEF